MRRAARFLALACAMVLALATGRAAAQGAAPTITMRIAGPGSQLSTIAVSGLKSLGGDDDHRVGNAFVSTLRRDLELSGYFRIIDPHAYIEDPQTSGFELGQFNFADWRSINADFVVKGSTNVGGDGVKLTAYLYDVAQQRRMMGKNYSGDAGDVPRMARRFADAILEAATGQKGPFDSKLAFVSTQGGRFKEIYTQSIDGQDIFRLTDNPTINLFPSFDRSTRYVLYLSYKSMAPALYLADLQQRRETRIESPHGTVIGGTLSPDGERIVASIERDGITNLYLLTRDGGEIRQLTDTTGNQREPGVFAGRRHAGVHLGPVGHAADLHDEPRRWCCETHHLQRRLQHDACVLAQGRQARVSEPRQRPLRHFYDPGRRRRPGASDGWQRLQRVSELVAGRTLSRVQFDAQPQFANLYTDGQQPEDYFRFDGG